MKDKKTLIIIGGAICIFTIIALVLASSLDKKNNSKKQNNTNNYYNNSEEIIINTTNTVNSNITNNVTNNTTNIISNEVNVPVVQKTANELFKEKLLSEDWIKQNLYIKIDCFGNEVDSTAKQEVKFMKIKIDSMENPVVLVYVECNSKNSCELYFMTYNNGEITANKLNESTLHNSHTKYDVNIRTMTLYKGITYAYSEEFEVYDIKDTGLVKKYKMSKEYKKVGSNFEFEYYCNEEKVDEKKYNDILNEYGPIEARGLEFEYVNEENINNNF